MNSRKAARAALGNLLDTISTFSAVYDAQPTSFGGLSPVAILASDGTRPGPDMNLASHEREAAILIGLWWERHATVEDNLDDLSEDVIDLLEANSGPTASWDSIEIDENFSAVDWAIVDGKMYRVEVIRVLIW